MYLGADRTSLIGSDGSFGVFPSHFGSRRDGARTVLPVLHRGWAALVVEGVGA
jgi:hypothetical protein